MLAGLRFAAIVLTALALVPGGAHLFAMPNRPALAAAALILATLAIFFAWTYPANQATENWTVMPETGDAAPPVGILARGQRGANVRGVVLGGG